MTKKIKPDFEQMHDDFQDLAGEVQTRYHQTVLAYLDMFFTLLESAESGAAVILAPKVRKHLEAFPDVVAQMFAESRVSSGIDNAVVWDLDEISEGDLIPLEAVLEDEVGEEETPEAGDSV